MSCGPCVEFSQKVGSLLPVHTFTLELPDEMTLAAAGVNFVWRPRGSTARNLIAMTIVDVSGIVSVELTAPAVASIGLYEFQFEITQGGKVLVLPLKGFELYEITETI